MHFTHLDTRSLLYRSQQRLKCAAVCLLAFWGMRVGSKLSIPVRPSQDLADPEQASLARLLLGVGPLFFTPPPHSLAVIYWMSQNPVSFLQCPADDPRVFRRYAPKSYSHGSSYPPSSRLKWPVSSLVMPFVYGKTRILACHSQYDGL
jgi:hypothetical protein